MAAAAGPLPWVWMESPPRARLYFTEHRVIGRGNFAAFFTYSLRLSGRTTQGCERSPPADRRNPTTAVMSRSVALARVRQPLARLLLCTLSVRESAIPLRSRRGR